MNSSFPYGLDFPGLPPVSTRTADPDSIRLDDLVYSIRAIEERIGFIGSEDTASLDYVTSHLAVSALTDVLLTNVAVDDVLKWNGSAWVNGVVSGGAGEANTASNVGTGAGVFKTKSGVDLQFKTILGTAAQITVTANANDLTLSLPSAVVIANLTASTSFTSSGDAEMNNLNVTGNTILDAPGSNAILVQNGSATVTALPYGAAGTIVAGAGISTIPTFSSDVKLAGYLRVGSSSAPANTTAGDLTTVRLFVGNTAVANNASLFVNTTNTATSGSDMANYYVNTFTPSGATTATPYGSFYDTKLTGANNFGTAYGGYSVIRWTASVDATTLVGFKAAGLYGSTSTNFGTIATAVGLMGMATEHFTNNPTGTISTATSIWARNSTRGGTNLVITNSYGVRIDAQTLGATQNINLLIGNGASGSWSIYNNSTSANYFGGNLTVGDSATTAAAILNLYGDNTGATLGSAGTINLYSQSDQKLVLRAPADGADGLLQSEYGLTLTYGVGGSNALTFKKNTTTVMTLSVDGNLGIGTATFGTSAAKVLALANGTVPSTSPADMVQLFSTDISAGNASLGIRTEAAVSTSNVGVSHTLAVTVNGTIYYMQLYDGVTLLPW